MLTGAKTDGDIWNRSIQSLGALAVRQRLTCRDDRDAGHVCVRSQRHLVWVARPSIVQFGGHLSSEYRAAGAFII